MLRATVPFLSLISLKKKISNGENERILLLPSFEGSHGSVDADSNILGYDAMLIDKQLLPFLEEVSASIVMV